MQEDRSFIRSKFARYVLVGSTTFAIDLVLFSLLHGALGWDIVLSNTISYWLSIVFNFSMNRTWTFKDGQATLQSNLLLYASLLLFNFVFSTSFLLVTVGMGLNSQVAKIIATGLQTVWTYFAYKKVIFK